MEPTATLKDLLIQELRTDSVWDDETSNSVIQNSAWAKAEVKAKQLGVFSGADIVSLASEIFGTKLRVSEVYEDGRCFQPGQVLARLDGNASTILSVERTLINFLMHLSGVATLTHEFVERIKPFPARLLATRKTVPGLRSLQLNAVVHGGGHIHRRSLSDGILIKENHLVFTNSKSALEMAQKKKSPLHSIEIEVQSLEILEEALEGGPDIILLDNLSPNDVAIALKIIKGKARVEVSGGITLDNVRDYAELGVDYISVGRLTHSAPAIDLSLELCSV